MLIPENTYNLILRSHINHNDFIVQIEKLITDLAENIDEFDAKTLAIEIEQVIKKVVCTMYFQHNVMVIQQIRNNQYKVFYYTYEEFIRLDNNVLNTIKLCAIKGYNYNGNVTMPILKHSLVNVFIDCKNVSSMKNMYNYTEVKTICYFRNCDLNNYQGNNTVVLYIDDNNSDIIINSNELILLKLEDNKVINYIENIDKYENDVNYRTINMYTAQHFNSDNKYNVSLNASSRLKIFECIGYNCTMIGNADMKMITIKKCDNLLSFNKIANAITINCCKNIQRIDLGMLDISSLLISNCNNLLDIRNIKASSIIVSKCKKITSLLDINTETLYITKCSLLRQLPEIPNLLYLTIDNVPIETIPMYNHLLSFNMSGNNIINQLPVFPVVKDIVLKDVQQFSVLPNFPSLKELTMFNCRIHELPVLPVLNELESLSLDTQIVIPCMPKLKYDKIEIYNLDPEYDEYEVNDYLTSVVQQDYRSRCGINRRINYSNNWRKLTQIEYDNIPMNENCPICFENLKSGGIEKIFAHVSGDVLHIFHKECLDRNTITRRSESSPECPICRGRFGKRKRRSKARSKRSKARSKRSKARSKRSKARSKRSKDNKYKDKVKKIRSKARGNIKRISKN